MMGGILVPYWWHATLLEVLWLAGGLAALPLAYANLADAVKDEQILVDLKADPSIHSRHYYMIEEAAKGRSFDQWLTMASACAIVVTGIVGCTVANPLGGSTTPTGFAITVCLVSISAVTATRAFSAMVRRRRMYELAAGRSKVIAAEMRAKEIPPRRQA